MPCTICIDLCDIRRRASQKENVNDMAKTYKPGKTAPATRRVRGCRAAWRQDGSVGDYGKRGDNLPPTDKPGQEWKPS